MPSYLTYDVFAGSEDQSEQACEADDYNKSYISLAKNPVLNGRSKHINTKFHFQRNQVQNGVLEVIECSTQKQLADMLTKTVKTEHFIHLRDGIYVLEFN